MQNPYGDDEDVPLVDIYPSDLLKTLRYMLTTRFISTEWLYKKYDINKNKFLSIPELKRIFWDICQIKLWNEELIVLSKYLEERFTRPEIKKAEFDELLRTEFPR